MKKNTIIQIIVIIAFAIILGILVKFTIEAINENNMPQMANHGMNGQSGNMPGQMDENSSMSVEKTGDSDGGDNTSFYGINSGIIAKDGSNLTLKNITVTTNATGAVSPTVYSTANVTINNCNLTDSNTKLNGLSTTYKNIFLYQSMSGDADTGNSEFTANNITLKLDSSSSIKLTGDTYITLLETDDTTYSIKKLFLRNKS